MRCLIDADLLRYECGVGSFLNKEGEEIKITFDSAAEKLDQKVKEIDALCWGDGEPLLFLSMCAKVKKNQNKAKARKVKRLEKRLEENPLDGMVQQEIKTLMEEQVYKPNFRAKVASKKEYKGNRKNTEKPLHYVALTEYMLATYEVVMAEGLEADDLLSIYQRKALKENKDPTTIICSRDKDLKITPGMHFSWECGRQSQFGPEMVSELGRLNFIYRGKTAKGEPKLHEVKGTGLLFFCTQLITGDSTDNIPGVPGAGPAAVKKALEGLDTYSDAIRAVKELYVKKFDDDWQENMLEQGQLLWMVAELDDEGLPVMWQIPEEILNE